MLLLLLMLLELQLLVKAQLLLLLELQKLKLLNLLLVSLKGGRRRHATATTQNYAIRKHRQGDTGRW